jgi:molybdopterin-containing oxidoreductase family iron-sulfur binding subunit
MKEQSPSHSNGHMNEHEKPKASALVPLESLLEPPRKKVDLTVLREKLAAGRGPAFWRTLEEAAETEDLTEYVEQEFPGLSGQIPQGIDRRNLLKVMGASLAMAGAAACTKLPKETIVPYVRQPDNIIPGEPMFFATAHTMGGYARGVLVESNMNRPTKVEGNPDHPASLGSTTIFEQGSLLNLYDPDRSESVLNRGSLSTWGAFTGKLSEQAQSIGSRKGEGLAILSGATTSPTLISQMNALTAQWPSAKWYTYEPSVNPAIASAAKKIAGRSAVITYDFSQAAVVLSLESDFLNNGPECLKYARQFSAKRAVDTGIVPVRYYQVESSPTVSGSIADHRFTVKSNAVAPIAYQMAKALGVAAPDVTGTAPAWLSAVAEDLSSHKGHCIVVPGEFQPESVHLAAYAMNAALGNVGTTVKVLESFAPDTHTLEDLTADLNGGHVEVLIIFGSNPVYDAPASLDFLTAMRKPPLVVRLGQYFDETSRWSHWHVPAVHYLESWSDTRAFDGTATIIQPLVEPLYKGKSAHELLSTLLGKPDATPHDLVKGYWQTVSPNDFDAFWKTSLHNGVVAGTAASIVNGTAPPLPPLTSPEAGEWEVTFRPDPTIGDGSFANNGWLQELPKPQTKTTWDNLIFIRLSDAEKLKVQKDDLLTVSVKGKSVTCPVWLTANQAEGSVAIFFGYGRTASGRVGNKIGYSAYEIQDAATPFVAAGTLAKAPGSYSIANSQAMQTMADRAPIRAAEYSDFKQHPNFPTDTEEEKPLPKSITLYNDADWPYHDHKWGMTIDLNVCTGCTACAIACQSENNIAVVGKDQVSRGRHMHWIRIDRYYSGNGSLDEPDTYNQPVPCMQCENAPCEVVCPVAATVHSQEGLNQMVYNRCVGTRYCSNNCPYKVRRFNFYLFSDWDTESLKGMRNPDVTVRSRGVMEKCSYCIQRIQEVKIKAEKENNRKIVDGEILTACQQVCPTQAITFGDLNDPNSKVAKSAASKRIYNLLDDLNNRPRTKYLGYVRNSNEALRGQRGSNHEG